MGFLVAAFIVFVISLVVAAFISLRLYRKLVKSGNKSAVLISVLTFVGSLVIVFGAIGFIILYNMPFER